MRILFLNPPNCRPKADGFPNLVYQPLGLAYLAAVLEKKGIKVKIIDAFAEGWNQDRIEGGWRITGLSDREIKQKIKKFKPDVVGVSFPFTTQAKMGRRVLRLIKEIDKKILTLAGGADVSVRFKEALADFNLDIVVIGEGEKTVLDLIQSLVKKEELRKVSGIAFRDNKKIIKTKTRPFVTQLDSLPMPARHLLPMEAYFQAAKKAKAGRVGSTLGKRWTTIVTSRGCPYNCVFCTVHQVMGRTWRPRSPKKVIDEIKLLKRKWSIQHLLVEDDNLTLDKRRAEKIFDLLIEADLGVTWSTPNGIRADRLDENLIKKMKRAGCIRLCIAPESGDQTVVNRIIKKNLDLKMVEKVVEWSQQYQLPVEAFFVIGFPGETKKQIRKTLNFAKKLLKMGLEEFSLFIATPFYGTELYQLAKKRGYLRDIINEGNLRVEFQDVPVEPLIETPEFSRSDLLAFRQEAIKISPKFSWSKIEFGIKLLKVDPRLALKVAFGRLAP